MSPTVTIRCTDSIDAGDSPGTRSDTIAAPTRKNAGAGIPTRSLTRFETTASSRTAQTTPIVIPKVRMSSTPGRYRGRAREARQARRGKGGAMGEPNGTTVAVLGTGTMGTGMAHSLARAGYAVRVWNRSRERAEPLADVGATVCDTAADAVAGADVVLTMVWDADSVAEVV